MQFNFLTIIFILSIAAAVIAILLLVWWKYTASLNSNTDIEMTTFSLPLGQNDADGNKEDRLPIPAQELENNTTSKDVETTVISKPPVQDNLDGNKNDELNMYRMLIIATQHTIHDAKNSMINIKLAVEEMREKIAMFEQDGTQKEVDHQLSSIAKSSQHVIRTLEGLLHNFTRTGSSALEWETVNIRDLWDEVRMTLRSEAKQNNVRLMTLEETPQKLSSSDLEIDIDRELIKQALRELVHNGIKYSKSLTVNPDESEAKVAVGFTVDEQFLNVHILDTGCGISDEEKNQIFEPGFRGQNANPFEGVGIGLYSVQTTIDAHGGVVELDNRPTNIPWKTKTGTKWVTMFTVKLRR